MIDVTLKALAQMLSFQDPKGCHPLHDDNIPIQYNKLANENKNKLLGRYMSTNANLPK